MDYQILPLVSILILMFHAFTLPLYKKKKAVYTNNFIISLLILGINLVSFISVIHKGSYVFNVGHYVQPIGIAFKIGSIEALMALLFSFIYALVMGYAVAHLKTEIAENKVALYYTLSTLLLVSLLGIVYTYDIFTGFVFLEVNTLAACAIIAIKDKKENIKATLKYMILSSLSSGLVLLGIAFVYTMTGHLSMPFIHDTLVKNAGAYPNLILISVVLFTFGVAIKAALFPLHVWLPDAYTFAPTVTSAILSSIVNKAPILFLIKLYYWVFGFELLKSTNILPVLLFMGAVAMIVGSLFARTQKELKRMVAYSSVAQMGYIFLGIGMGNVLGLTMAIYQMIAHALTKSTIFLSVGLMMEKTGFDEIDKIKGIGKHMPLTLAIFTVCGLSMVGIPVLPGFINKWNLAIAAIEVDKVGLLFIILASSLLNATYYFPVIIDGYFGEFKMDVSTFATKNKQLVEVLPLLILTLAVIGIGLFSGAIIDAIQLDFYKLH